MTEEREKEIRTGISIWHKAQRDIVRELLTALDEARKERDKIEADKGSNDLNYLDLSQEAYKLRAQLTQAQADAAALRKALESLLPCDCKYKPYTHQYFFKCKRCEAIIDDFYCGAEKKRGFAWNDEDKAMLKEAETQFRAAKSKVQSIFTRKIGEAVVIEVLRGERK